MRRLPVWLWPAAVIQNPIPRVLKSRAWTKTAKSAALRFITPAPFTGTAEFFTNGGRVLGVTACGAGLDEALEKAYDAVERIFFDGAHYRKDIGKIGIQ